MLLVRLVLSMLSEFKILDWRQREEKLFYFEVFSNNIPFSVDKTDQFDLNNTEAPNPLP